MDREQLYDRLVEHIYELFDTHEYENALNGISPEETVGETRVLRNLIRFIEEGEGRYD